MLELFRDYKKPFVMNGKSYENITSALDALANDTDGNLNIEIILNIAPNNNETTIEKNEDSSHVATTIPDNIKITVKDYMTNYGETFFLSSLNKSPMPSTVMSGVKIKETNKLVYMRLHCKDSINDSTVTWEGWVVKSAILNSIKL